LVAGPREENDTDAQARHKDESTGGEAGIFAEQFSKKIAELDVLVVEVNQQHVDEAQSSPEVQALIAGDGLARR
jgi:hypothetical protein